MPDTWVTIKGKGKVKLREQTWDRYRNIPLDRFDSDTVEGYNKMHWSDKRDHKNRFLRTQPEYIDDVYTHCGSVPCLSGKRDDRFGIPIQTCLECGYKFVPVTQGSMEMTNEQKDKLQEPFLQKKDSIQE